MNVLKERHKSERVFLVVSVTDRWVIASLRLDVFSHFATPLVRNSYRSFVRTQGRVFRLPPSLSDLKEDSDPPSIARSSIASGHILAYKRSPDQTAFEGGGGEGAVVVSRCHPIIQSLSGCLLPARRLKKKAPRDNLALSGASQTPHQRQSAAVRP